MRNVVVLAFTLLTLSACETGVTYDPPSQPERWVQDQEWKAPIVDAQALRLWWLNFNDPVLNLLIGTAMANSPDVKEAEGRILEARGNWRASRAALFPLLTGEASKGRQDLSVSAVDDFYDATFDASYEIDIFGKNRNAASASRSLFESSEEAYKAVTLGLIAEVARNYIQFRSFEKQAFIAEKNLRAQEKTLELVRMQKQVGAAPQLDVERAETLVNTTHASIEEFKRQANAAKFRLTVLTGLLPDQVSPMLEIGDAIPGTDISPILATPADVLALRPDIRAASLNFAAQTDLANSAFAEFFPSFTIGGFFGIEENALAHSTQIWSVALGTAMTLLDFGRIQGRVDAAQAREAQAYEVLRKTVLQAVADVETALSDYAHINRQSIYLDQAQANARNSLTISEQLYKEGEISFLDVLDAQRTANDADSAVVSAQSEKTLALIALYKALGVF